jgi:hypothetical protein
MLTRLSVWICKNRACSLQLTHRARVSAEYCEYIEAINPGRHDVVSPLATIPKNLNNELNNYKAELEARTSRNSEVR